MNKLDPKLVAECHPTKNGDLKPEDVAPMSHKRIWWKGTAGHTWSATAANRSRGSGCPYCSGKKVASDNNLQAVNPELAKQWHPTKNGELTAKNVTPMSNKKAWWRCPYGHEWEARVSSRSKGTGCPFDSGKVR